MSLTELTTRAQNAMDAPAVNVEVHISNGLPAFSIVGLPEAAVRESRDRVRSAIINSGFEFPVKKIIVNLAPADLPKQGGRYDLAIALGILASSRQINSARLADFEYFGELALSGELRPVSGLVPALIACRQAQHCALLSTENAREAGFISALDARAGTTLAQICQFFNGGETLPGVPPSRSSSDTEYTADLSEVLGQAQARRALELAAAGHHHLLMMGPPGTGKSMLAQRLNSILPDMNEEQALQTLSIQSISNHSTVDLNHWKQRPFRSPHHTVSAVALVGGGVKVKIK
jgi:magnesium chelatase family protein